MYPSYCWVSYESTLDIMRVAGAEPIKDYASKASDPSGLTAPTAVPLNMKR